jgi:TPP-dependent pyruvate/acetoin dehydrogenase alpha subunit
MDLSRQIQRIRYVELELAKRYPDDVIRSPMHLSLGQEWVSVGVCASLRPEDKVIGTYRSHALYLAKGGDLKAMLHELYGHKDGCCGGNGGSMHLADARHGVLGSSAIVGTNIPVATGWAYAGYPTACFFGDAATEEGAFYESANFAVLHSLPVLFVCENNGLAVNTKFQQRSDTLPLNRAAGFRLETEHYVESELGHLVDRVSRWRSEPYPLFIECMCRRLGEHVGPKHNVDALLLNIDEEIKKEVDAAFREVEGV